MDLEDDIILEEDNCDLLRNDVLQNFPFIEDDFDALSDYELFSKGFEYLDNKKADKEDVPKLDDYYNKDEINNLLDEKADISDIPDVSDFITKDVDNLTNYYDKDTTDDLLDAKADISDIPDVSDFITKDVDNLTNYYDKDTTDDLLDAKADISDIPDVSDFITKDVNNLTNYMLTSTINTFLDKIFKKNDSSILTDATIINITPLVGSNYSSYSNSYYYKIGSKVHIHLGLQGLTANTLVKVFDIPTGYRPYSHLVSVGQGGGSDLIGQGIIEADLHSLYVKSPSAYLSVDFVYDAFN